MLLAIWPQSSFYSVQGDSLSPVLFAIAFIALAKMLQSDVHRLRSRFGSVLTLAATCLVKTANLPLLFVVAAAVIYKAVQLIAQKMSATRIRRSSGLSQFPLAVPLAIWFAWNQNHFGDLTATKSKIEILGWTAKPFVDWWSHPIFSLQGLKEFWPELIASFWRGEFIWHHERMASWWSDAFYWTASTIVAGYRNFQSGHTPANRFEKQPLVCVRQFHIVGRLPCSAIDPVRFRALRLSISRSSLLHFRTFVERRGRSVLSVVRLRNRAKRKLDEARVGAMGFARRNRIACRELAIIDNRTGVFQPV